MTEIDKKLTAMLLETTRRSGRIIQGAGGYKVRKEFAISDEEFERELLQSIHWLNQLVARAVAGVVISQRHSCEDEYNEAAREAIEEIRGIITAAARAKDN